LISAGSAQVVLVTNANDTASIFFIIFMLFPNDS